MWLDLDFESNLSGHNTHFMEILLLKCRNINVEEDKKLFLDTLSLFMSIHFAFSQDTENELSNALKANNQLSIELSSVQNKLIESQMVKLHLRRFSEFH